MRNGRKRTEEQRLLFFSLLLLHSFSLPARAIELNKEKMKLFSRGSAAKHDFEVTLYSVSSWPAEASSDLLVVSWRRGARRAGSIVAAGNRRRIDGGDDSSTATTTLDLSGATIAVPATMYKVRRG